MSATLRSFKLATGQNIPGIGFGTGTALYKKDAVESVARALRNGYRHIDTASMYDNEESVGKAIAQSGVSRSDLWITTKMKVDASDPEKSAREQLKLLGVSTVDLYLIHTPELQNGTVENTWKVLETFKDKGIAHAVGVSNFRVADLKKIEGTWKAPPAANQIEFHPYVWKATQELYKYCKEKGITLEAYSPLAPIVAFAGGPLDPVLAKIAKSHDTTSGSVLLAWTIAKGVVPVSTSNKDERLQEYLKAQYLTLREEEIAEIENVGSTVHNRVYMKHMDN